MDIAILDGCFKATALKRVNYCQMYLNVTLLSDVTNPEGTCINDAMYRGHYANTISHTDHH